MDRDGGHLNKVGSFLVEGPFRPSMGSGDDIQQFRES